MSPVLASCISPRMIKFEISYRFMRPLDISFNVISWCWERRLHVRERMSKEASGVMGSCPKSLFSIYSHRLNSLRPIASFSAIWLIHSWNSLQLSRTIFLGPTMILFSVLNGPLTDYSYHLLIWEHLYWWKLKILAFPSSIPFILSTSSRATETSGCHIDVLTAEVCHQVVYRNQITDQYWIKLWKSYPWWLTSADRANDHLKINHFWVSETFCIGKEWSIQSFLREFMAISNALATNGIYKA